MAESYAPGASATAVAVRHGLHRNQIFAWRRQFRGVGGGDATPLPEFVPVALAERRRRGRDRADCGGVTIRVGTGFDAGDLRRVLQIVRELG